MTQPDSFDAELEEFSQQLKAQEEQRNKRPAARIGSGILIALSYAFFLAFFIGGPFLMYHFGSELYHFHSCEQATVGRVTSAQKVSYHRGGRYQLTIAYTPAGGNRQQFTQRTADPSLTPIGTTLPVRCKPGHAFIDDGCHNVNQNILWVGVAGIFWYVSARILCATWACGIKSILLRALSRLHHPQKTHCNATSNQVKSNSPQKP